MHAQLDPLDIATRVRTYIFFVLLDMQFIHIYYTYCVAIIRASSVTRHAATYAQLIILTIDKSQDQKMGRKKGLFSCC